jgi:hypothetical protein
MGFRMEQMPHRCRLCVPVCFCFLDLITKFGVFLTIDKPTHFKV